MKVAAGIAIVIAFSPKKLAICIQCWYVEPWLVERKMKPVVIREDKMIQWGMVGYGRIATTFARALEAGRSGKAVAVAGRSPERAAETRSSAFMILYLFIICCNGDLPISPP